MEAKLPSKLPFSKKPLRARVIISYILDYVILVVLVLGFVILDRIEPYHQPFALQNYTLHYPYAVNERVPMPMALGLSGGVPILTIIVYTILLDGLFSHHKPSNRSSTTTSTGPRKKLMGPYRFKDRLWELNCGILGLFLSQAAAFVITGALKNAVGKPRPDVIDRCQLGASTPLDKYELATYEMCNQEDHHVLKDGFKSFPSGHSSSSFAGLFYLSLYLGGKLHIFDSRGEVWKSFVALIPTLGAGLIAATRIMDARHHPFDVIFGSLIGVFCAWGSYRQYFPSLSEPWRKGRAYPIRTWGTASQPPPDTDRMRLVHPEDHHATPLGEGDGDDTTEYRGVSAPTTQQPAYGPNPNPFEPDDGAPNPFLQRIGTDVPSNYSSSSSGDDELGRMDSVSLYSGRTGKNSNNSNNNMYEMRSQHGSRRRAQQQKQQPRTVEEEEEATDLAERPFTGYSAYRPPPPAGREESPEPLPRGRAD